MANAHILQPEIPFASELAGNNITQLYGNDLNANINTSDDVKESILAPSDIIGAKPWQRVEVFRCPPRGQIPKSQTKKPQDLHPEAADFR